MKIEVRVISASPDQFMARCYISENEQTVLFLPLHSDSLVKLLRWQRDGFPECLLDERFVDSDVLIPVEVCGRLFGLVHEWDVGGVPHCVVQLATDDGGFFCRHFHVPSGVFVDFISGTSLDCTWRRLFAFSDGKLRPFLASTGGKG